MTTVETVETVAAMKAMERATMANGVELEYRVVGRGEPVLLIGTGPIADSFFPLTVEVALAEGYRLNTYRQRGQGGSTRVGGPVAFEEHAADAAGLLRHLGIRRAHVAGHSTGAAIALQLCHDYPEMVQSLALLEPPLTAVPSAGDFFERVRPAVEAHGSGEREQALASFLSVVCGLEWDECRRVVDERVPGGVALAIRDADTFFGSYLPALGAWRFGVEQAAAISQPVLSVVGTETEPLFAESHGLLRAWFPKAEECRVEAAAHLLHVQRPEPVARGLAEFFARHPLTRSADGTA